MATKRKKINLKTKPKKITKPKALTPREKKAIIEKEVHCHTCNDHKTLAFSCTDDGVPVCIRHS